MIALSRSSLVRTRRPEYWLIAPMIGILMGHVDTKAVADNVMLRQIEYMENYYQEFDNSSELGVDATITFHWAYTTMTLNKSSTEIDQANVALGQWLTTNATLWDNPPSNNLALVDSYWDIPMLGFMVMDPDLSGYVTSANKTLINQFLQNYAMNRNIVNPDMHSSADGDIERIYGSENHDIHERSVLYMTSMLLKDDPAFANQTYIDGDTPEQRYSKWTDNLLEYFPRKASEGSSVEFASPTYQPITIQPIFTIAELSQDERLSQLAETYLDLLFADMGQETLHGIRGGAKVRAYKDRSFYPHQERSIYPLYLFTGEPAEGFSLLNDGPHLARTFGSTTSDYRVPEIIGDLFADEQWRGTFEYVTNRPGQGIRENGIYYPDETSAILRTSYVTPDYVLGWFTIDETESYMEIHTQNQWMGAITGDSPGSRVVVHLTPGHDERKGFEELQAVGKEDAVLIRKQLAATPGEQLRVYVSSDFTYVESNGWVFGENNDNTYFAFRGLLPSGASSYQILDVPQSTGPSDGKFFQFDDEDAVVLLQMGRSSEHGDFNGFLLDVLANPITWDAGNDAFQYQAGPGASTLKMFNDDRIPWVDGAPLNLTPNVVYDSPYLHGTQGSKVIAVTGLGGETLDLDFNYSPIAPLQSQLHQSNFTLQGDIFSPGYRGLVGPTQVGLEPGYGSNFIYMVDATGVLEIDIDGEHLVADQLLVDGNLVLDGELRVDWIGDPPLQGVVLDILDADQITGQFATVNLPPALDRWFWRTDQLYTTGQIELVEGASILLGDQDEYVFNGAGSADDVYVDPAWASLFTTLPHAMLDEPGNNRHRLASFDLSAFDLSDVVSARLEIMIGEFETGFENDGLKIDALSNGVLISSLKSIDMGESGELLYYEFTESDLDLLTDGLLNIAIQDDTTIDWVRFAWSVPEGIPGDFDSDGDVDGADFLMWQSNPSVGDLADWQANYGTTASTVQSASVVPEPSTLILLASIQVIISFRYCYPSSSSLRL